MLEEQGGGVQNGAGVCMGDWRETGGRCGSPKWGHLEGRRWHRVKGGGLLEA